MTGAKYVAIIPQEELAFFYTHIKAHGINPVGYSHLPCSFPCIYVDSSFIWCGRLVQVAIHLLVRFNKLNVLNLVRWSARS